MVRLGLEYCIQVWVTYIKGDIRPVEQVQSRATKLALEVSGLTYEHRLTHSGLITLEEHRVRGNIIQNFLILRGFDKVGDGHFLKLSPIDLHLETRGHSMKL